MKKLLAALGAIVFIGGSAILSTGAPIPLLTGPNSGCNEASQLLFCMNGLISILNGATGSIVSFGANGLGSTTSLRGGSVPNPQAPGGVWPMGSGTGACVGGSTTAECGSPFTPVVANGQRGIVTFATPIGAQSNSSTLMVMNSFMTAGLNCQATLIGGGTAGAGAVPFLASLTPTTNIWSGTTSQGVLLMTLGNAGAVTATTTYTIGFWCQ